MSANILSNSQVTNLLHLQRAAIAKPRNARKRKDNRTQTERKESAKLARLKKKSLWMDLNDHWRVTDRLAVDLAAKHGKTTAWVRKQLFQTGRVHVGRRSVSRYNAWLHCKSLVINEGKFLFLLLATLSLT